MRMGDWHCSLTCSAHFDGNSSRTLQQHSIASPCLIQLCSQLLELSANTLSPPKAQLLLQVLSKTPTRLNVHGHLPLLLTGLTQRY